MPKFVSIGDKYTEVVEKSKKHGYLDALTKYDERDPTTSFIEKEDHISAYFKQERKSNYKPGMVDALGIFDDFRNFHQFYKTFILNG